MKKFHLALLLVAMSVLVAQPAAAQSYDATDGTLVLADTTLVPGQDVSLDGSGYDPGSNIAVTIESTPRMLGNVKADGLGALHTDVSIPSGFPSGQHTIKATGVTPDGATHVLSVPVTVTAGGSDAQASNEGLAVTGSSASALAIVAVGLLAAGAFSLMLVRRRAS